MSRSKTIGENPLDIIIPDPEKKEVATTTHSNPSKQVERERVSLYLPKDLAGKVRDAVYWTPGITLSDLGEEGVRWVLKNLEKKRGSPFPKREREIRRGRPCKA